MPDHSLSEEPDLSIIQNQFSRLNEIWSGARRQWTTYDSYYFRTYAVWDGTMARKRSGWLKPARPTSIVDHAVDHQLAAQPIYHRFPTGDDEADQKKADRVEKYLDASSKEQALAEPSLLWKTVGKNLVHLGYAVVEKGMDGNILSRRASEPVREDDMDDAEWRAAQRLHEHYRRTSLPFRTRAPHPRSILMDPWEKRPRIAIRHYRRFAQDIEDMIRGRQALGKKVNTGFEVRNNNPFETFIITEWWSDYYHAYVINGLVNSSGKAQTYNGAQKRLLFVERNMWGFVPYGHAFAGFGQEPTEYDKIDPKYLAVGILDSVMPDIKAQAQAISARHNAVMEASFDKILLSGLGADEVAQQIAQGDFIENAPEGSIRRMDKPSIQRWMFQEEEWLSGDIEDGTFSRQLAGRRDQGVSTVGQQAILTQAAGRKFVGVARQMEHLASVQASQELQLIDIQDFDLTVRGNKIKRSDLDSDYSISTSFDIVDPVMQLQSREIGMREVQAGLKSIETYWSADAHLEDASGERQRMLQDFVRKNPLLHQELVLNEAKNMGVGDLFERAIERAKQAQSGSVNGNGRGNGQPGILGPDGMPLQQTMGSDNGMGEAVNGALTGDVFNPDRRGNNRAG